MPRKLASRSTQGCWTCRLRKKKCDENHPSCARCTSLRIICDGYGPKPHWMDRGDMQREQARYKTQIIARIKQAMRENQSHSISGNTEPELDTLVAKSIATSSQLHPSSRTQDTFIQNELMSERNFQLLGGDGSSRISNEAIWCGEPDRTHLSSELFCDQTICMTKYDQCSSPTSETLSTSTTPVTPRSNAPNPIDISRPGFQPETNSGPMVSLPDWMMGGKYPSELSVNHSGADWSLSFHTGSRLGLIDLVSQPASLSNPILRGNFEDNLFMYYLDHVFYIYCPFYFPSNRQGRGWLFSILKRVK